MQNAENLPFDKSLKMFIYFRIVHFSFSSLTPDAYFFYSLFASFLLLAHDAVCLFRNRVYWMVYTAYTHLASDYQITVG